jgi:hypothetical protein
LALPTVPINPHAPLAPDFSELDVFYGDLTANRAYIYARLPRPLADQQYSLVGQVRGPRCALAQTLPCTSPLVDLGPGPTLLARATIPDPCYWSGDLPAIYDVTVNILRGTEIVGTERREIGLRNLGVRGRYLAVEGKRWVLRGIHVGSTPSSNPNQWHAALGMLIVPAAHVLRDELLAQASSGGAMTAVVADLQTMDFTTLLRQLARFPAVSLVVVRGNLPSDFRLTECAPNLLLAQAIGRGDVLELAPWAQLAWVQSDDPLLVARVAALAEVPVVAVRPLVTPLPLEAARAACDELQRDLAPSGQYAGYVV